MGRLLGQKYDCHEPLACPYGYFKTSLAQFLIIIAWALSLLTVGSCYFLNARPNPYPNEPVRIFLGYGMFSLEGGGDDNLMFARCGKYTDFEQDEHVDGVWRAASAFAILPLLIGGFNVLALLTTCCLVYHDNQVFVKLYKLNLVCFVLQVLVFIAYANSKLCGGTEPQEYICTWGSGSGLNLAAAIAWLLVALLLYTWPEPSIERDYEEPTPIEKPRPNYPMLTAAPRAPAPAPSYPMLTGEAPPQKEYPALTNGQKKQKEYPALTNGQKKQRPPSNRLLTNGEPKQSNKNLRITNGPKKKTRPSDKNLMLTEGQKGSAQNASGRKPRR